MSSRRSWLWLLVILFQGCFFNPAGCLHLPTLPDGGDLADFPDASAAEVLAYEAIVGDPGPILDGGSTSYGALYFVTTFDGGERIETMTLGPGGKVLETLVYPTGDDSSILGTGDINLDGITDYTYASVFDGQSTYTTTISTDSNFDGVFDSRDVWVVDVSGGRPYQKTETFSQFLDADGGLAGPDAGGSWVQQWTSSGPAEAEAGGLELAASALADFAEGCNGQQGFPANASFATGINVPNTHIWIQLGSESGDCTIPQAQSLTAAFESSISDMATCLGGANPLVGGQLKRALSTRSLYVACGNTQCGSNFIASTDLPYVSESQSSDANERISNGGVQQMNVNPNDIDPTASPRMEEFLNHELLHFAGIDHTGPNGDGMPAGHDLVYGCGRYCTACTSGTLTEGWGGSTPTPQQWAFDCADCADPARVVGCGVYAQVTSACDEAYCSLLNPVTCGNGASCCTETTYNCFHDGAADPGSRSQEVYSGVAQIGGTVEGACIAVSDGTPNCIVTPLCSADQFINQGKPGSCSAYPVGFCGGP